MVPVYAARQSAEETTRLITYVRLGSALDHSRSVRHRDSEPTTKRALTAGRTFSGHCYSGYWKV